MSATPHPGSARDQLGYLIPAPDVAELARAHEAAAKAAAQRCIDELAEIRRQMLAAGTGDVPVTLVKAVPSRNPLVAPPKTRTARGRQRTGHEAAETTMRLAQLLNALTPGGFAPDHRLYLIDPPTVGTTVDPQAGR